MERQRSLFVVNRVLIVVAVAAVLAGLSLDHWNIVLLNARLLCLSCLGLE